jgi:hypothetical protein
MKSKSSQQNSFHFNWYCIQIDFLKKNALKFFLLTSFIASSSSVPVSVPTTKPATENKTGPSVQQTKSQQKPEQKSNTPQGPSMPIAQHTVEMIADDSKLGKSHPSLLVIVKPSRTLPPGVCSKKRESLGTCTENFSC